MVIAAVRTSDSLVSEALIIYFKQRQGLKLTVHSSSLMKQLKYFSSNECYF